MMKIFGILLVNILFCSLCFAQDVLSEQEKVRKQNLGSFIKLIADSGYNERNRSVVTDKYVYLDYVLIDTVATRRNERLLAFDMICKNLSKSIDSIGLGNLDAKPLRFFHGNKSFYKNFEGDNWKKYNNDIFVYFDKRKPDQPLGSMLFQKDSAKLISWILIDDGNRRYFLTVNMF